MYPTKENTEETFSPSPLELLYTAYSREHPIFNRIIAKCFGDLDTLLASLTENERAQMYRTIYEIYTENECQAFRAGVRTGVRLGKELI